MINHHTPIEPSSKILEAIRHRFMLNDDNVLVVKNKYHCGPEVGEPAGSPSGNGYLNVRVLKRNFKAHHVSFYFANGRWPSSQLDHINGNKTDNRPQNLEEVSSRVNSQRYRIQQDTTSKNLGTCWNKQQQKFRATIKIQGIRFHLGYYECEQQAGQAYQEALANLASDPEWLPPKPVYSSTYRGVSYNKQNNKFRSAIRVSDKTLHLGHFTDEALAGKTYEQAHQLIQQGFSGSAKELRAMLSSRTECSL